MSRFNISNIHPESQPPLTKNDGFLLEDDNTPFLQNIVQLVSKATWLKKWWLFGLPGRSPWVFPRIISRKSPVKVMAWSALPSGLKIAMLVYLYKRYLEQVHEFLVVSVRVLVNPQSTNRDLGRRINLYLRMTTMQKEKVPKIFSQIVFSWWFTMVESVTNHQLNKFKTSYSVFELSYKWTYNPWTLWMGR